MNKLITIISIFLLLACNSKKESNASVPVKKEKKTKTTPKDKTVTNGKAMFKQRGYNKIEFPPIDVSYSGYNSDYFQFKSDEDEKTDTNGDGYVVYGVQNGDKFKLSIIDLKNGKSYDSGNKITHVKKEDFFLGSGLMDELNTHETINISFWVTFR